MEPNNSQNPQQNEPQIESPPPTTPKQTPNNSPAQGSGNGVGIAALILSFFAAPIGLILGIVSLKKAASQNNLKTLGILSIIFGSLGTIFGLPFFLIIFFTAYSGIQEKAALSDLGTRSVSSSSVEASVSVPKKWQEKPENVDKAIGNSFFSSKSSASTQAIRLAISKDPIVTAANVVALSDETTRNKLVSEFGKQHKLLLEKDSTRLCDKNLNLDNGIKDTVSGADIAIKFTFSCDQTSSDSDFTTTIRGVIIDAITKDGHYSLLLIYDVDQSGRSSFHQTVEDSFKISPKSTTTQ